MKLSSDDKQIALRIQGNSMAPLIVDGDWILVEKRDEFESGELVVADIDDGVICRRLHSLLLGAEHVGDTLLLVAENIDYAPIPIDVAEIVGRVVGSYRSFIGDPDASNLLDVQNPTVSAS